MQKYLPQDRLLALARNETLPDRAIGSALFADISGFTALTENLHDTLGPRRGAEEITKRIEAIFTALIAEVENYGGSVINFAGDALTCWFERRALDAPDSAFRACACAFALQTAMRQFPQLTLKVSIARGTARRFVVGDPEIQLFDVLAGATLTRMAAGEHLARQSEILVDEFAARQLGAALAVREWRTTENGERFAVAESLAAGVYALPRADVPECAAERLRAWIPSWLYAREDQTQETFLNEFRVAVFIFARFTGIDYDADAAPEQLDLYLRWAQKAVRQADGYLRAPNVGDKGSYLLVALGVPSAHEDDMRRALRVAFALRDLPAECSFITSTQIGIAAGVTLAGLVGGGTRRAYDFMGDHVNLAARLMQAAGHFEILTSERVQAKLADQFAFGARRMLQLKGKTGKIPAYAAYGAARERAVRLQEPAYSLPMIGRRDELQTINARLDLTLQGAGQIVGVTSEAGMGKSRLLAEALRLARSKGFIGYGGACQSDGLNAPYLAWKTIWSAFFEINPSAPPAEQIAALQNKIEKLVPERAQALPLLKILLDLPIPDNDFTKTLEPSFRRSALRALLEDCLRAAAKTEPVFIVVEDLHWIDAVSHDLLEDLARALRDSRVCFALAYRPPQIARIAARRLELLPNFTEIQLLELDAEDSEKVIQAKLGQLYPAWNTRAAEYALIKKLTTRAQGNPFFLEELLNFMRDRELDPQDPAALEKLELPDSLHTLILSRIDQLSEREKTTLRAASIIGRLFRARWLAGYYPELGDLPQALTDLDHLARLDITPLDTPEPELTYLFKHIVTHEATYESIPFGIRFRLHERLAQYLERQIADGMLIENSLLDALALHYARSENQPKQRYYLRKAADAALRMSAFAAALAYLTDLEKLTPPHDPDYSALNLQIGETYYRVGAPDAAKAAIRRAESAALTDSDRAAAQIFLCEMTSELGEIEEAKTLLLGKTLALARACGDPRILSRALYVFGDVEWRIGSEEDAHAALKESIALSRSAGDTTRELFSLNRLGTLYFQIDLQESERILREALKIAVAIGNRERESTVIGNLGFTAADRYEYAAALEHFSRALELSDELGALHSIAIWRLAMSTVQIHLGERDTARRNLGIGFKLTLQTKALQLLAPIVMHSADFAYVEGRVERALALMGLFRSQPWYNDYHRRRSDILIARWDLDPAEMEAGMAKGALLDWNETVQELMREYGVSEA